MDTRLREQVVQEVRQALDGLMDTYTETWLPAKEMMKVFGMFSPEWLHRYGWLLPRAQAVVTDKDGRQHRTGWAYPRNRISRMISDGSIERLIATKTQGR